MILTDGRGAVLVLGNRIGRGGEGEILLVPSRPQLVAKLYHAPPGAERAAKLRTMIANPPAAPPDTLAWPLELIYRSGEVAGFLMKLIADRREIHQLVSGLDRRRYFPQADYRMLVATAANLARVMAAVHVAGHVVGDVNQRCAMIDPQATVALLDTDSFQIAGAGRSFRCDVGTIEFQPPELQGVASFHGLPRTRNHDIFGLAVLVFQLLFLGRHPFAGVPVRGDGLEFGPAIRACQFAWAADARRRGLLQPPNTLALATVGTRLAGYFEHAFTERGVSKGRPKAAEWADALRTLFDALQTCRHSPAHAHLGAVCPLCDIELATGRALFVMSSLARQLSPTVDRQQLLWKAVQAEPRPRARAAPPLPIDFVTATVAVPYPHVAGRIGFGRLLQSVGLLAGAQQRRRAGGARRAAGGFAR